MNKHEAPPKARASGGRGLVDQPYVLMLLPGLFWAGNAIVARSIAGEVPPVGLAFWRWTAAAVLIAPLALPHLRGELLHEIDDLLRRMNRVVDEHELWIERHDAFHDYLHYWSGRPRLVAQIRQLRAAVQPYLRLYVEWKTQTEKHGYEHEYDQTAGDLTYAYLRKILGDA